jgi:hypothetical protein
MSAGESEEHKTIVKALVWGFFFYITVDQKLELFRA